MDILDQIKTLPLNRQDELMKDINRYNEEIALPENRYSAMTKQDWREVTNLVEQGSLLYAVKHIKQVTTVGLKEAKGIVDKIKFLVNKNEDPLLAYLAKKCDL